MALSGAGGAGAAGRAPLLPLPAEPRLVDHVLQELKSQGIFDQFRKECISDVDTKPAYQNLRQRVEGTVAGFLNLQSWSPDLNKNQLREKLRKHIFDSNYLDQGVERIVDQVVNPKIASVFIPHVEEIVYKCLGLQKPTESEINGDHYTPTKAPPATELPTDLETVSPESIKSHNKSAEISLEDIKTPPPRAPGTATIDEDHEAKLALEKFKLNEDSDTSNEEEFESPAFEPLETNFPTKEESHLSIVSEESKDKVDNSDIQNSNSQLSEVSSDSNFSNDDTKKNKRITDFKNTIDAEKDYDCESMEVVQAPPTSNFKFNNENSSDARQYFEESVDTNMHIDSVAQNDNSAEDEFYREKTINIKNTTEFEENVKSKTTDSPKMVCTNESLLDSNESNSVFAQNKTENESYSFENKISSEDRNMDVNDSSNSSLKTDTVIKSDTDELIKPESREIKDNSSNYKSSKDRERHSSHSSKDRDKKDDSRHHSSKSSHSRHSSSGRRDSDRRHSSSHDRRDSHKSDKTSHSTSRDSHSNSKDRHGRNGDSRNKSGSSSHRSSNSSYKSSKQSDSKHEKSSRDKHSSSLSRHDSRDSERYRDSSKSKSDSANKSSSHSKTSESDRKSTYHSSSKDKSSSKQKDDKKNKSSKDDSCSTASKSKRNRRSSDRDSNDGNGSSARGSNAGSYSANTSQTKPKSSVSSVENSSNGTYSSGQSDSVIADQVNITKGSYIKSEFNMFQFGSMNAIKRHSITEKSPSLKSPEIPGKNILSSPKDPLKYPRDLNKSPYKSPKIEESLSEKSLLVKSPEIPSKKPIHIDSQLNPVRHDETLLCNITSPVFIPKKPKFASNIFEARKIMKVRKQMDKIERKKKQEAILIMEQQQNIPTNSSQVYSGLSGPEVKIPCVRLENTQVNGYVKRESNIKPDFNFYRVEDDDRLVRRIENLNKIIDNLERQCFGDVNSKIDWNSTNHLKNGYKNKKPITNKVLNVKVVDVCTSNLNEVKSYLNPRVNIEIMPKQTQKTIDSSDVALSQKDIMEIILGDMKFDDTTVYYKHRPLNTIKLPSPNDKPVNVLKRKRTSASTSSCSDASSENINHNNNVKDQIRTNMRKIPRKSRTAGLIEDKDAEIPGSPDSDKSIENHVNKNTENNTVKSAFTKNHLKSNIKSIKVLATGYSVLGKDVKSPTLSRCGKAKYLQKRTTPRKLAVVEKTM